MRFQLGDGHWVAERDSVGFTGEIDLGLVRVLTTAGAFTHMLNPGLETPDSELAIETNAEFGPDIHRITRLEFVKRSGGETPIVRSESDVGAAASLKYANSPPRSREFDGAVPGA